MVSKDKIIKSTIGAVIGVAAVAGMAGAANNSQPQQTCSASSTTCNIFRL